MKLLLLLPMFLIGCAYQTANQYDLEEATQICATHNGIAELLIAFDGQETVTCNNNHAQKLHKGL